MLVGRGLKGARVEQKPSEICIVKVAKVADVQSVEERIPKVIFLRTTSEHCCREMSLHLRGNPVAMTAADEEAAMPVAALSPMGGTRRSKNPKSMSAAFS
jgi:hypothetical protein